MVRPCRLQNPRESALRGTWCVFYSTPLVFQGGTGGPDSGVLPASRHGFLSLRSQHRPSPGAACASGTFPYTLCIRHAPREGRVTHSAHFTGEDTEALRCQAAYPQPHSQQRRSEVPQASLTLGQVRPRALRRGRPLESPGMFGKQPRTLIWLVWGVFWALRFG